MVSIMCIKEQIRHLAISIFPLYLVIILVGCGFDEQIMWRQASPGLIDRDFADTK